MLSEELKHTGASVLAARSKGDLGVPHPVPHCHDGSTGHPTSIGSPAALY